MAPCNEGGSAPDFSSGWLQPLLCEMELVLAFGDIRISFRNLGDSGEG